MRQLHCLAFVLIALGLACSVLGQDCTLTIPANPLSATGLSTPFWLAAGCNQNNPATQTFVQGAIIDHFTGQISIYNPLVVDQGSTNYIAPVVPVLPSNYTAALWFGTNANTLTLVSATGTNSLQQGNCIEGIGINGANNNAAFVIFGQFSYCNAPAFFLQAAYSIINGLLTVPPLGIGKNGKTCYTVRSFEIVDQDQSDNVVTSYVVLNAASTKYKIAQDTKANRKTLTPATNTTTIGNGSDNRLLDIFYYGALGCTAWSAPDLADPGSSIPALPLNEIQALLWQNEPAARVPASDPMVMNNGLFDVEKINAYRRGVFQFEVTAVTHDDASPVNYCKNFYAIGAKALISDKPFLLNAPDPAGGNALWAFLVTRYIGAVALLNCPYYIGKPSPITANMVNDVVVDAQFADSGEVAVVAQDSTPMGDLPQSSSSGSSSCTVTSIQTTNSNSGTTSSSGGFFDPISFAIGLGAMFVAAASVTGVVAVVKR